ncbi:MAG: glycosyltransferase family 1 protein, partial [Moraxellaceae bacterium]
MSDLLHGQVVIDATRQYRRVSQGKIATGIDKVDLAYIRQYQHQAQALLRLKNRWYVLTADDSTVVFEQVLQNQPLSKLQLLQFCIRAISSLLSQQAVLINTSHSGLEQPDYAQKVKKRFKKAAFFLHDIIPLEYPEYCKAGEQLKHQQRVNTILQSGNLIIANSQDTLNKLNQHTQNLQGCSHTVTTVAMLGMSPKNQMETTFARPEVKSATNPLAMPYFVILGTIEPRKNHLLLLQVWRRLAETLQEKCPKLYI